MTRDTDDRPDVPSTAGSLGSRRGFLGLGAAALAGTSIAGYVGAGGNDEDNEEKKEKKKKNGHGTPLPPGADPIPIDSPTTITEPGLYRLVSDITVDEGETAIIVEADDVWVDGGGHTIDGDGAGIRFADVSNLALGNFTLRGPGISSDFSDGGLLMGTTFENSGLRLYAADDWLVANNTFVGGDSGLLFTGAPRNVTFVRNRIEDTGGLTLVESPQRNRLFHNDIVGSDGDGLQIGGQSPEGARTLLVGNRIEDNDGRGVGFFGGASGNVLLGNAINGNGDTGLHVRTAANRVIQNEIAENGGFGIELTEEADDNEVLRNTVCDNANGPYSVDDGADGNEFVGNETQC